MNRKIHSVLLLFCVAITSIAAGDIIYYPDLESTQMLFTDVTESSVNEALPLFGIPTASGSSLVFDSPLFEAASAENELEFIDGRMTTTVTAKNGQSIFSVTLSEFGTYENTGADSNVAVNAIGFAIAGGKIYQGSFSFQNSNVGSGKWEESFKIEFDNPVSSFSFVADNQLFAQSGSNSTAFINKEGISVTINAIPEPGTSGMAILALIGSAVRRRRS